MPFAFALALCALVTITPGVGLPHLWTAALMGAVIGFLVGRRHQHALRMQATDRARLLAGLVFALFVLVPLVRLPVAPGADMAMHVALARALRFGSQELSPAWGALTVDAYPRGFSALCALLAPMLGFARGGLVAAGLAYFVYFLGTRALLSVMTTRTLATVLALVALIVAKSPQRFFGFGSNPTALAMGLGFWGLGITLAHAEAQPLFAGLTGGTLLAGAIAIHPIGGLVALCGLPVLLISARSLRERRGRRSGIALLLALSAAAVALLWLNARGPALSPGERAWVLSYQQKEERLVPGPLWALPFSVLAAIPQALGDVFAVWIGIVALGRVGSREGRRRIASAWVGLIAIGAILEVGQRLSGAGLLFYPDRFAPLLAIALLPLAFEATGAESSARPRLATVCLMIALGFGLAKHVGWYQTQRPIATTNDLRAIHWLDQNVEPAAVIDGAYGDATQWVPALTGRAITHPHTHISLEDEIGRAIGGLVPTYRFEGERLRYPPGLTTPTPSTTPIHRVGGASLYRLAP